MNYRTNVYSLLCFCWHLYLHGLADQFLSEAPIAHSLDLIFNWGLSFKVAIVTLNKPQIKTLLFLQPGYAECMHRIKTR